MVITAAVIPGKKSPVLVTAEMVARMAPGSVIVDLAAERGGNCELTKIGEKIVVHGVTIIGWINLASTRAVPREPDVRAQPDLVSPAHRQRRKAAARHAGRNRAQHAGDAGRRNGEPARAGIFLDCRLWRLQP